MTPHEVFRIANTLALVAWLALILGPRWTPTVRLVRSGGVPLVLALGYWASLGFMAREGIPPGASFGTLDGVKAFFSSEWGLLAGWIHYLAFDLLVGVSVQSKLEDRSPFLRAPLLVLVFMLGPVGWSLSKVFTRARKEDIP